MALYDGIFPLGLGTNRFPIASADDEAGVERSAGLVLRALEAGVRYIDVAPGYSRGMAYEVLRRAFARTRRAYAVTLKSRSDIDKTADGVRRRAESSLKAMGIDRAAYVLAWSVFSYAEFEQIMAAGGMYEGMLRLKDEGIADHICFSTHAPVPDIIKILDSGAFEGMTISYSLLNSVTMREALDAARERNIGVAVMNPLGGGVIAQNRNFFAFARNENEQSTLCAALRFVKAHPAVKVVLSGVSALAELEENLAAFTAPNTESDVKRIERVNARLRTLHHFCTGCNYCAGCPQKIPVSTYMQSRNTLLFAPTAAYNRTEPELLRNIQLFRKLSMDFNMTPETPDNPCVRCGRCEAKCTQKLKIIEAIDDFFKRVENSGFSKEARRKRLHSLLNGHNYQRVGIYPSGGYFAWVYAMYHSFFGAPPFEFILFNSDSKTRGTEQNGFAVHNPNEINALNLDVIVIGNYNFSNEIYDDVKHYEREGIRVVKLHTDADVPYLF